MSFLKSCWFHHDYNAANDAKILFLRQQLGMEGYGIYWFILEQLAQAGGRLPLKILPVLAMQTQTQETKVRAVIEGYELFLINEEHFFSIRLNNHLDSRRYLSEMGRKGGLLSVASRGASSDGSSKKERKKEKENRGFVFSDDKKFVIFPNGEQQELGESQLHELKNGQLSPKSVIKGNIY